MQTTHRPELALATQITTIIVGILLWIVLLLSLFFSYTDTRREQAMSELRRELLQNRTSFLKNRPELVESLQKPKIGPTERTGMVIILFSILLFIVSLQIAKKVIAPIEALAERERAYARHVAHELKTPLTLIKSDLELALALPDESRDRIESAIEEVRSMQSTVDDLLILVIGEAGIVKKPVDIRMTVLDEIKKDDSIEWNIDLDSKYATVDADSRLILPLIKNLVANVRVHALPGKPATVRFEPHGFVFENDSEDIPDTIARQAFDPFVGTPGVGSGIGLSLVKRIAELHAWTVSFEVHSGKVRVGVWW